MRMLSCCSDSELINGFEMPFIESANYLGMDNIGSIHTWLEDEMISESIIKELNIFIDKIL